jgi:transcriptional/translational regulatory protein YebC/TACO1
LSAIKAGTSEGSKGQDFVLLEGTGPDGIGIIVEVQTDNPKRCLPDIKKVMSKASLITGSPGCVAWMFDKRGLCSKLELEMYGGVF